MSSTTGMTQLHGKWLTLARAAWIALAVLYVGAFLVSVPLKLATVPDFTSVTENVTQAEFLGGLAQMGISPNGFIAYRQWIGVIIPIFYLALAFFIFWRKSDDWMALLTSFIFLSFLSSFDVLAPLYAFWSVVSQVSNILTSITLFLWFFTFPDGRFVPRWISSLFLGLMTTQIWRIFQPDAYQKSFPLLAPVFFGSILLSQLYRYRHAGAVQRQQIKWVVFGIVAGVVPLLVFFIVYFALLNSQSPLGRVLALNFFGDFLWESFLIILPVSLTLAIFRSRLFDIDIIIRRTLIYSILTTILAFVYFGVVIVLQQLLRFASGQASEIAIIISTLTIAALFNPLRRRIQQLIDRRFYRRKYDAQQVLARFAQTARDETDLNQLTTRLIDVVEETMQPASVSIWLIKERL